MGGDRHNDPMDSGAPRRKTKKKGRPRCQNAHNKRRD